MLMDLSSETALYLVAFNKSWRYKGDFSEASIRDFLSSFESKPDEAVKFSKLIRHPGNPDLFFVQSREFDELIVKSDKDYLVGVYPPTPEAEMILGTLVGDLASLFVSEKLDGLRVAYMDPVGSVPPNLYFQSRYEVAFVLFSSGNFHRYTGDPTLKGLVTFIASKSKVKFDVSDVLEKALSLALKKVKVAQSDNNLEDLIIQSSREKKLGLVAFLSSQEPRSREMFLSFLARLSAEEQGILFIEADVHKLQSSAMKYNVRGIPTFVLFKGGSPIDGTSGEDPQQLLALLQKWLPPANQH
jgi:hypothetical protein